MKEGVFKMSEQITVTKEELLTIVEKMIERKIGGQMTQGPNNIFNNVALSTSDFEDVNKKFVMPPTFSYSNNHLDLSNPLQIAKSKFGGRITSDNLRRVQAHDYLRMLTQRLFGVCRNKDIEVDDYEFAEQCYREMKGKFLELYEKNLERKLEKKTEC